MLIVPGHSYANGWLCESHSQERDPDHLRGHLVSPKMYTTKLTSRMMTKLNYMYMYMHLWGTLRSQDMATADFTLSGDLVSLYGLQFTCMAMASKELQMIRPLKTWGVHVYIHVVIKT